MSDYFCDIVPALSIKRRTGAKWIAFIYHCETDPKVRPGNRLVNELTYRMQRWSFKRIAAKADSAWISDRIAGDEIERRRLGERASRFIHDHFAPERFRESVEACLTLGADDADA